MGRILNRDTVDELMPEVSRSAIVPVTTGKRAIPMTMLTTIPIKEPISISFTTSFLQHSCGYRPY
jgi:hypothetical protein